MSAVGEVPESVRVPLGTKLFYGLGAAPFGVLDQGLRALLLLFYSQIVGVNPAAVGTVLMVSTLIDAFIDPVIGEWSDNLRSRMGRRHPFMYASMLPSSLLFGALWFPPAGWSDSGHLAYMATVLITLRVVVSFYEIPSVAQGPEITADYDERTSMISMRYFFLFMTGAVLTVVAYTLLLQPTEQYPVGQLNPEGYKKYGVVAGLTMLVTMFVSAVGTHRRLARSSMEIETHASLGEIFREIGRTFSNRPFLTVTGAGIMKSMALGTSGALSLYFSTYYWELSPEQISFLVLDGVIGTIIAAAVARPVSARLGKKMTAILFYAGSYVVSVVPIVLRYFGLFVSNDSPLLLPILFGLGLIFAVLGIGATIMTSSMISDVVEDSELKTGRRSEGLIFSASSLVNKSISGLGILAAGLLLSAISFPEGASPGEVPPEKVMALATYAPVIGVLYALGTIMLSFYNIDRSRHEDNLTELRARLALAGGSSEPQPDTNINTGI